LVPVALAPANRDSAVAWTRATLPRASLVIRFRWRYQDARIRYAGRGSARIAPPDSMRFDYAGPLGFGAGAAVVIGDGVAWADPAANFRSLVPAIPMLWASLGMVQAPAADALVFSLAEPQRAIWRFAGSDGDTLDVVATLTPERVLEAEWRREGKVVARSRTRLDPQARPISARIDFPEAPARFELTVVAMDTAVVFPPALWRSRR
jgi:hypothetical protein